MVLKRVQVAAGVAHKVGWENLSPKLYKDTLYIAIVAVGWYMNVCKYSFLAALSLHFILLSFTNIIKNEPRIGVTLVPPYEPNSENSSKL